MVAPPHPLDAAAIDELQALLAAVPAPLEPLEAGSLDGFLCGILVQPRPVGERAWWPYVLDIDARPPPRGFVSLRLQALVRARHAELAEAIARRRWFDPWVFADESDEVTGSGDFEESDHDDEDGADTASIDAVQPWVTGFTFALETFPLLLERDDADVTEPLALLYRHLGADHLEDADALLAQIESLAPPETLAGAVEELVRATLLLADAAGVPRR